MKIGKVYLVGAGPGDPKLLTIAGRDCLRKADVVIYDALVNETLLDHCPPYSEKIYAGKRKGIADAIQSEINRLMIEHARNGKIVVRLKGGDPFIFGRGGEEILELVSAKIPFEIVPGVSSATAVPAYAGIPLTIRDLASSFAVVTGHTANFNSENEIAWKQITNHIDTIVILMGVANLRKIADRLILHGRSPSEPTAIIHRGTTDQQKTIIGQLKQIADLAEAEKTTSPAVIVVGEVVNLREKLRWFDLPLFGRSIAVTRPRGQNDELRDRLATHGATVLEFPTTKITPISENPKLDHAIQNLQHYNWIVFTSVNAVEIFFDRVFKIGFDTRIFGNLGLATIGEKTSEALKKFGFSSDFTPSISSGKTIADELPIDRGDKILLPRSKIGSRDLPDRLRERGFAVDDIPIYDTIACEVRQSLIESLDRIDLVIFMSPSAVASFVSTTKELKKLGKLKIAVIGSTTAKAVKKHGLNVEIIAKEPSIESLISVIISEFSKREEN